MRKKNFGIRVQFAFKDFFYLNGILSLFSILKAKDGENAEEGVLFMQEMIQLAKERGEAEGNSCFFKSFF